MKKEITQPLLFDDIKECSKCNDILPLDRFTIFKTGKADNWCKVCRAKYWLKKYGSNKSINVLNIKKNDKIKSTKYIQAKIDSGKSLYKKYGLKHKFTTGQIKDVYLYLIFKTESLQHMHGEDIVIYKKCKKGYKDFRNAQIEVFTKYFNDDIFKREHIVEGFLPRLKKYINV